MMWWFRFRELPTRLRRSKEPLVRSRVGLRAVPGDDSRDQYLIWLPVLGLIVLVLHLVLFPPVPHSDQDFPSPGGISDREIRAPFAFSAPLPEQNIRMQRMARVVEVPPVLRRLDPSAQSIQAERLHAWLGALAHAANDSLGVDAEAGLLALQFPAASALELRRLLGAAQPDSTIARMGRVGEKVMRGVLVDILPAGKYDRVTVKDGTLEQTVQLRDVTTQSGLEEHLLGKLRSEGMAPVEAADAATLLRRFLAPNLVYDPVATKAQQEVVRGQVATTREYITGERIVDQGVRVTEEQALSLAELRKQLVARGGDGGFGERIFRYLARAGLLAIALGVFGWLGSIHFPDRLHCFRSATALVVILVVFLGGAAFALGNPSLGPIAVPIVLLALLATVLFRDKIGYTMTLLAWSLLALLPEIPATVVFPWFILGMVTVVSVRRIQKRSQFYKTFVLLTFLSVIQGLLFGVGAVGEGPAHGGWLLVAIFAPILSVAFGLFLMPIVEPAVGVCSDLTLLELSDLNHPLLQRMALAAQGTYHHSQVVGQLAEHAARAIDANALLTRVGALFHDIGKMEKPEYYVENQRPSVNKHDELSPSMSALVIAAHVKEGIELARKWRLPQMVIDFIPEHHGTMVMEYFYRKALEADGNETVKVDDFRYPGPKPGSRETAVLMLADAAEAATRSLARPTPSRIREMVKQIIDKRMLSGELDESGLTLSDLARIRESFIPLLTGIHHARIAYPGQRAEVGEGNENTGRPREKRS